MSSPAVAVVGTGRMGAAMATRLCGAGIQVVLYNRTADRAAQLAGPIGATLAATAREAAERADVMLVSLADDQAVLDAYAGPDGLAAGVRDGVVVLETSTVDPHTVATVRPWIVARGGTLLDAPVSGSVPLVERGELTFMVGGAEDALARVRPVLDVLATRVFHVGGPGSGAVVKLAVNTVIHALNQALCEAIVLAERAGVPRATTYEVLAASAAASPFVHYKRAAFEHPDETLVAFTLDLVAKDLDLITRLGERVGAPMAQAETDARVVREAVSAGLGAADMSAIARFLATRGSSG